MTETFPMLPLGLAIVRRYAAERAQLERSGRKKSDFDLMIACSAIEHEATLVTNDGALKDGAISGLVVEDWLESDPRAYPVGHEHIPIGAQARAIFGSGATLTVVRRSCSPWIETTLAALCDFVWRKRHGQRPSPTLWREPEAIPQEEATHVERILSRLDQLAAVWSRLPVGGALAFAWPALEPRIA